MRKLFEHILLSLLVGISILLGLTFWLNTQYGFNLFSANHWNELAQLQASHAYINGGFYISIGVAIILFILSLYVIYQPKFRKIKLQQIPSVIPPQTAVIPAIKTPEIPQTTISVVEQTPKVQTMEEKQYQQTPPQIINHNANSNSLTQPPKLHLPSNIAEIAAAQHQKQSLIINEQKQKESETTKYNDALSELFTNTAYLVKENPTIKGFKTNLFAIGNHELVWIGGVDCDITRLKQAIKTLKDKFKDTLPEIPITIYSFLLDTKSVYDSDEEILVFHNMDDLKKFIYDHQGTDIDPEFQEDFDAYSEYIDTILTVLNNNM
jgi:hypothetical protein